MTWYKVELIHGPRPPYSGRFEGENFTRPYTDDSRSVLTALGLDWKRLYPTYWYIQATMRMKVLVGEYKKDDGRSGDPLVVIVTEEDTGE